MPAKKVGELMTTGVIYVTPEDPVADAIEVMTERHISCVIVTEGENNTPVGIITERDLVRRVLGEGKKASDLKAKDVMTKSVTTVSQEASLEEALRIIESMKIRRLPVVGENGLVGLITQTDIVRETMSLHKHNQRLTFHQNLQSYIIIAIAAFVALILIYQFILRTLL